MNIKIYHTILEIQIDWIMDININRPMHRFDEVITYINIKESMFRLFTYTHTYIYIYISQSVPGLKLH